VKVYVVVTILFKAGDQLPVILFVEVVGRAAKVAPEHIGDTGLKVGMMFGFTVMIEVVVAAHCPASGVNVYIVVPVIAVLIVVFQIPVMGGILVELNGSAGGNEFWHKGPIAVKVGAI
jgi:hypothetical protein